MPGVLIIEDQPNLRRSVTAALREAGYSATPAATLGEASACLADRPDLILLDIMLPDGCALDWLRSLRTTNTETPVLILTARDSVEDRVKGLDSGADDYLVKPFSIDELFARIRALLRRGSGASARDMASLTFLDLRADLMNRQVFRGTRLLELTPRQFDLLIYLMRNGNRTVSRDELAEHVWKQSEATWTNVIEVHVNQLRKRLESADCPTILHTVRGSGYRLGEPH
jgi:DNA-binding response OmpR family regulator